MKKIQTLGHPSKKTFFSYEGSVNEGTTLIQSGKPFVSADFYKFALEKFSGQTILGGFSMTKPIPGGFGEWIQNNSRDFDHSLSPRHGSFIAAILVSEGYIKGSLEGNKVTLRFP